MHYQVICSCRSLDSGWIQMKAVGRLWEHVISLTCEHPARPPQGSRVDPLTRYTNHINLSGSSPKIWFLVLNSFCLKPLLLLLSADIPSSLYHLLIPPQTNVQIRSTPYSRHTLHSNDRVVNSAFFSSGSLDTLLLQRFQS